MIKFYRARSLLYRRQILQENIRWEALDKIRQYYIPLHLSDRKMSATFRQQFCRPHARCGRAGRRRGPVRRGVSRDGRAHLRGDAAVRRPAPDGRPVLVPPEGFGAYVFQAENFTKCAVHFLQSIEPKHPLARSDILHCLIN